MEEPSPAALPAQSPPPLATPPLATPPLSTLGDRVARMAAVLLAILLAAPLVVALILLLEFGLGLLVQSADPSLRVPVYAAARLVAYGLPLGLAALAVRRFVPPPRRRRWWIGLGIAAFLLLAPFVHAITLLLLVIAAFRTFVS